jgi:hypothetical protein
MDFKNAKKELKKLSLNYPTPNILPLVTEVHARYDNYRNEEMKKEAMHAFVQGGMFMYDCILSGKVVMPTPYHEDSQPLDRPA